MRTTMNLPDALMEEVRRRATSSGRTTTSLVEEALRMLLDAHEPPRPPTVLPTYGDPDGHFLVDLEDKDALWAILDEPE